MKKIFFLLISSGLFLTSCDEIKEKTKDTINKGGEKIGKTASEFVEGVSEGIEKSLEREIIFKDSAKYAGVSLGKQKIESNDGSNNQLVLYMIFNQDFADTVFAKAFDKNNVEVGRSQTYVEAKSGDAKYYDFNFNKETYIEVKGKITLE